MDNNWGIKISTPGVDVKKATNSQLVMNTKYPFIKLDTQKPTSFQTILLLFIKDPPEPSGVGTQTTTVYSFAHGYTYTPRVWALFQTTLAPLSSFNQTYFQDTGVISAQGPFDQVQMYVGADATDVYIKVDKTNFGGGSANNLIGSTFKITTFTFVEDLT